MNLRRTLHFSWHLLRSWSLFPWIMSPVAVLALWTMAQIADSPGALLGVPDGARMLTGLTWFAGAVLIGGAFWRAPQGPTLPITRVESALATSLALCVPVWVWTGVYWALYTRPLVLESATGGTLWATQSPPSLATMLVLPLALTSSTVARIGWGKTADRLSPAPLLSGLAAAITAAAGLPPLLVAGVLVGVGTVSAKLPGFRARPDRPLERVDLPPAGALLRGLTRPLVWPWLPVLVLAELGLTPLAPEGVRVLTFGAAVWVGWMLYRDLLWSDLSRPMPEKRLGARLELQHLPVRAKPVRPLLRAWFLGLFISLIGSAWPALLSSRDLHTAVIMTAWLTSGVLALWLVLLHRQLDGLDQSHGGHPNPHRGYWLVAGAAALSFPSQVVLMSIPSLRPFLRGVSNEILVAQSIALPVAFTTIWLAWLLIRAQRLSHRHRVWGRRLGCSAT